MDLVLQIWGGFFYLINKVFFAMAERSTCQLRRRFSIMAWAVFIIGVPAWGILLIRQHCWIAASIEIGSIPTMIFGLYNAWRNQAEPKKIFKILATISTYGFMFLGVSYSLYNFDPKYALSITLETGVIIGFFMGSYLLAQNKAYGWFFYMLMNMSTGTLMFIREKYILSFQQLLSLMLIIYTCRMAYKNIKKIKKCPYPGHDIKELATAHNIPD
jgi:uncharacterized protein YggT (Ycf19 family)